MLQLTPIVRILLLLNIVVFVISLIGLDLNSFFALHPITSAHFEPYQFLTYMFAHGGFAHLFFNMFGLYMFGPLLEQHWGSSRFLFFYLVCGVGAGLLYSGINYYEVHNLHQSAQAYFTSPSPQGFSAFIREYVPGAFSDLRESIVAYKNQPANTELVARSKSIVRQIVDLKSEGSSMVGASGALFGILMAFGMLFPNLELMLLFLPVPIKAKYFVLLYGAYELYAGLNQAAGDNVAHFAHLGGMLFAFILIKVWQRTEV